MSGSEMALMGYGIFSNKKTFLLNLKPQNTCALFEHYLVFSFCSQFLLLEEARTKIN